MKNKPAIVVIAYNRLAPLKRLISSIEKSFFEFKDIDLVISIDKSDQLGIIDFANQFNWINGNKRIIAQKEHLGLKQHVMFCASLSNEYGSVILLEDDIIVSPWFYNYAVEALQYYGKNEQIAGISLYNYEVAESCFYPFKAIDDGTDVYFMQVASSWGQLFTKQQWSSFEKWFSKNTEENFKTHLPNYLQQWGKHSWKRHFICYLISENKYFVFPRLSLSTNCEEEGINSKTKNVFHVPLQISFKEYLFCSINQSNALYDAWFEIKSLCLNNLNEALMQYDYEVDLYGTKDTQKSKHEFVLSTKLGNSPKLSFAAETFPLESNVILRIEGQDIGLYKLNSLDLIPAKLKLRNLLTKHQDKKQTLFIIYIIIENWNKTDFDHTINSIVNQNYPFIQLVFITTENLLDQVEKEISYLIYDTELLKFDEKLAWTQVLIQSIQSTKESVVSWLWIGSTYKLGFFNHIDNLLKFNPNILWLRGINEPTFSHQHSNQINVRTHRLIASEAYELLKKNRLNDNLELNFISSQCFSHIYISQTTNQLALFFCLIKSYQLHIVVANIGNLSIQSNVKKNDDKERIIKQFSDLQSKDNLVDAFFNWLSKSDFIQFKFAKWFYTTKKNYPAVLRFDEKNNSFFFSKY
jgi:hypothetical protein